jgi:hypothetical protein
MILFIGPKIALPSDIQIKLSRKKKTQMTAEAKFNSQFLCDPI